MAAAALCAAVAPGAAMAQAAAVLPFGSLSFIAPTGNALNTDVIDVWVRFTLDAGSPELNFSNNPLTGIDPSLYPTQGTYYPPVGSPEIHNFASIQSANLNVNVGCAGTFIGTCVPGSTPYTFDFHFGVDSMVGRSQINLQPGDFVDYKLGTFTPQPGGATPGSYSFSFTGLTLEFVGLDAQNNTIFSDGLTLASQCPGCEFTRTVTAVPEPSSYAMLTLGLASLAVVARRRRSAAQPASLQCGHERCAAPACPS